KTHLPPTTTTITSLPHSYTHRVYPSFYPFFFYCYGDPRDLHSFPTRRSSDLLPKIYDKLGIDKEDLDFDQTRLLADTIEIEVLLDRKSTRLNSSHLVISYAVFCLKKKNK